MNLSRKTANRFVPQLEALEDRMVLSTASFNPATGLLQITGTSGDDHIHVVDSGNANAAGAIKVFDSGALIFSSPAAGGGVSSVKDIKVDTFAGNDIVKYDLTGNMFGTQRTMEVDLGAGDDCFYAAVGKSLGFGASLKFNALGQDGNDKMLGSFQGALDGPFFLVPASSVDFVYDGGVGDDAMGVNLLGKVNKYAHLGVDMHGSDGADKMVINALNVGVDQNATLDLEARGQAGQDRVAVNYAGKLRGNLITVEGGGPDGDVQTGNIFLKTGSDGSVNAQMNAGPGNDTLRMFVRKQSAADPVVIAANVDGGPDTDTLFKTANVTDTNCEVVTIVP